MNKPLLRLLWLALLFTGSTCLAQKTRFQKTIGGSGTENSYSIKRTLDGGYISVGYTTSFGSGQKDVYLVKTNGIGEVQWSKSYGGSKDDQGWKIALASDSGFVVVGTTNSYNNNNADALIFKTDKSGTVEWTRTFASDSVEDGYNVIKSLFSNGYYVTGYVRNDSTGDDAFLAKLGSNGNVRWYKKFGSKGNEEAYSITEDSKGNVLVCGVTTYDSITQGAKTGNYGDSDGFLAKFDSTGNYKWMRSYGTPLKDNIWDVEADKNDYYMLGWSRSGAGDDDIIVIKTDTSGSITAQAAFGSTGDDRAFNLQVLTGPKLSIVGYMTPLGSDRDVLHVMVNGSLNLQNYAIIGAGNTDGHWPTDATIARDGGITMLSTTNSFKSSSDDDFYIIKADESGTVNCNSKFDLVNQNGISFKGTNFGSVTAGFNSQTPSITTTTITTGIDSTICCKIVAETAQDSFKICEGTSVSLGRIGTTGLKYTWTDQKGSVVSNNANPTLAPSSTNIYKLVVSSNDGKCAPDSAYVKVNVIARINYDFARDTSFCDKDSVTFTTRPNMSNYQWVGKNINASSQSINLKKSDTIYFTGFDVNSCVYRDTMIVTVFDLPVFELGKDTTICENTPITIVGPANMTSYNWNSGDGSKQSYTTNVEKVHTLVVVNSNGCKYSDTKSVFTNPYSAFSLGEDDKFCEGGKYTILGPGALGNYIWNDTASKLQNLTVFQPGKYHLTAFNSFGCPYSDTITLTTRSAPTFNLGSDFNLCIGTSKYVVGPTKMKSYAWASGSNNDSLRITTSGTYVLTVTDSFDCRFTDTIKVADVANPVITLGPDSIICIGDSLMLTPGSGYTKYTWSTGEDKSTIYVKNKGTYSVGVVDGNGCIGNASMKLDTMTCQNDAVQNLNLSSFKSYPVPVVGSLFLDFLSIESDILAVAVINISGQKLKEENFNVNAGNNHLEVKMDAIPAGFYFIQLHNRVGTSSFKVWVE